MLFNNRGQLVQAAADAVDVEGYDFHGFCLFWHAPRHAYLVTAWRGRHTG
jgi:hypothetical protein